MFDASTLIFGLTYTGTLAVALLMLIGQLAAFAILLALVGTTRLVIMSVRALLRRPRSEGSVASSPQGILNRAGNRNRKSWTGSSKNGPDT